jgi:hypothetical protein
MRIVEEINHLSAQKQLSIIEAIYEGNFKIKIKFNDNTLALIDFKPFLTKSVHPEIRKYLKEDIFKSFSIIGGNMNWNDYDMIFPLEDLYEGKI